MARIYEARTVRSMLRDHERGIRQQAMVSKLQRTGLSVPDAQVTAVDGDLQAESFEAGVNGWRLQAGGNAEFNDLTLRGGIIGNDALTTPLVIGQGNNGTAGFGLSTSETTLATVNLTVPTGFTGLSCIAIGGLSAVNPTANLDYMYARIFIDTYYGDTLWQPASGNNGSANVTVFKQGQLSGLISGATIPVTLRARTQGAAWAANGVNIASLNLLAFWLR